MDEILDRAAKAVWDQLIEKGGHGRTLMVWENAPEREWCFATARKVLAAAEQPVNVKYLLPDGLIERSIRYV